MTLNLRQRAERTAQDVLKIMDVSEHPNLEDVTKAIEHAIIQALIEERGRCADMAFDHVSTENKDRAHEIAENIRAVKSVLISNLSSMR